MAFSSRSWFSFSITILVATALALYAGSLSGCAHARAARAESPRRAGDSERAAMVPRGELDPSEEITPEELASIPEPVPAPARATTTPSKAPATRAPEARIEPTEPPSGGNEAPTSRSPESKLPLPATPNPSPLREPVGPWVWRVQILATPDRGLAERVAREAAERLGTTSRIDSEPPLHKVPLGGLASEADAQVLKARAVEMGYPGAFRVKIRAAATDE
mgnify:CR=1 FL=1